MGSRSPASGQEMFDKRWWAYFTSPLIYGAVAFSVVVFALDALTLIDGAASTLLIANLALAATRTSPRGVGAIALVCVLVCLVSYIPVHGVSFAADAIVRRVISASALAVGAGLVIRGQIASAALVADTSLLDLTEKAIFVRDATGIIRYWSPGAEMLFGWDVAEAVGQDANALLGTGPDSAAAGLGQQLGAVGRWHGDLPHRTSAGRIILCECRSTVLADWRGAGLAIMEARTDVTRQRQADQDLRRSEERYRSIYQTAGIAIWEQDYSAILERLDRLRTSGVSDVARYLEQNTAFVEECVDLVRLVDINDTALTMFEAEDKSELLVSLRNVYRPGSTGSFGKLLGALAVGAASVASETQVRTLRGRNFTIYMSVTFPVDRTRMDAVLVSIMDIEDRRRAEESLARARESLARMTQVSTLGEVTASIAHEVNQALAGIVSNAEAALRWLGRTEPEIAEACDAARRVVRDGVRATEIVAKVRDFSSRMPPSRSVLQLIQLIDEASLIVQREMMQGAVTLRVEMDPDLPAILGDRIQMEQVVVNLFLNAVQVMTGAGGTGRVLRVRASLDGSGVAVEVEDTGPGIPDTVMPHLFEPFFTTKPDGMGLGLSICKTIVEAHGGRISAGNSPAGGACFTFTLPGHRDRTDLDT